jgi:hypothetical protein
MKHTLCNPFQTDILACQNEYDLNLSDGQIVYDDRHQYYEKEKEKKKILFGIDFSRSSRSSIWPNYLEKLNKSIASLIHT